MRTLPNMTVVAPGDPIETALATQAIIERPGPCYLRLGRATEHVVHQTFPDFQTGKAITVRDGSDVTLIATGGISCNAVQAAEELTHPGIQARVLSMPTIKPLDTEALLAAARQTKAIVTVEEHSIIGGLGSAVAEALTTAGYGSTPLQMLGVPDTFCQEIGGQEYLRHVDGLSIEGICTATKKFCEPLKSELGDVH
jgi:transketolase